MSKRRSSNGFTLIELMVVVAIIGLITATVTVRFSASVRRAKLEWAIGRMTTTESGLRNQTARHARGGRLSLELGTGQLRRSFRGREQATTTIDLGSGVELVSFLSKTRDVKSGRVVVDYSQQGTTETFAVEIETQGDDSTWLLFAGLTGQITRLEEERHVEQLLQTVRPSGIDPR